jgi:hypothetical protein
VHRTVWAGARSVVPPSLVSGRASDELCGVSRVHALHQAISPRVSYLMRMRWAIGPRGAHASLSGRCSEKVA